MICDNPKIKDCEWRGYLGSCLWSPEKSPESELAISKSVQKRVAVQSEGGYVVVRRNSLKYVTTVVEERSRIMCNLGSPADQRVLPVVITLQWLKDNGTRCKDALQWFKCAFPEGGSLSEVLAACSNKEWIHWLIYKD